MPRFHGHGQSETKVLSEGDARFTGIDMTRDRPLLQPGTLALSQNKRLFNGIAATRPGCVLSSDFNPGFTNRLVGSGVFSNPNGGEVLLVGELNANFVWVLQSGLAPVQIPITSGTLSSTYETGILDCFQVKFVQAFDHVYLLRRPAAKHSTLIWDGTMPPSSTAVFTPVTQQPGAPTTSGMIPGGVDPATPTQTLHGYVCPWNGEPFAERILLYNDQFPAKDGTGVLPDRDTFIMTDPDRWDSYNPAYSVFRINSGESNILTRVMGYYRGAVLVFFQRGVHMLENFTNPPTSSTSGGTIGDQRMINDFLGSIGNQSNNQIGVDVHFLSEPGRGVYRISEAVQDQVAVNPLAVSDNIQPIIDSVGWGNATLYSDMKSLGLYVYLGLSTGTLAGNNIIAVYNQYTRQWESIDTFGDPNFSFKELHVLLMGPQFLSGNQRQLVAVDWDRSQIYQMYMEGQIDDQIGVGGSVFPINDIIETRGYTLKDPGSFKRFERVNIGVQTFNPAFSVQSLSDGYNEVKNLTDQVVTKNHLRYYIHGHKFFNPVTDDPNAPKREDYGDNPTTSNFAIEDFESLMIGPISSWPGTNVSSFNSKKQQTLERYQIRQNGRYSSIRITNSGGNCDILSVDVDAFPTQEGLRTLA